MKAVLFVLVSVMFAGYANAQTAEIKVAERDCSKTTLSKLFYGQSRWLTESTENSRANSDDSKCTQSDIQSWLTTVSSSCSTYFDVVSITPITKGFAQFSYHSHAYADTDENGRSGAYLSLIHI